MTYQQRTLAFTTTLKTPVQDNSSIYYFSSTIAACFGRLYLRLLVSSNSLSDTQGAQAVQRFRDYPLVFGAGFTAGLSIINL